MFPVLRGTTFILYPYFLFAAIHHLKSSPTFSVRPCSSVGRVMVDLIRRSWVRFPPRSKRFFFLPRVVPCFPLLGLTPSGLFMGLSSTIIYTSELILCSTIWFSDGPGRLQLLSSTLSLDRLRIRLTCCTVRVKVPLKFEKRIKHANEMTDDIIHSTQYYIGYINRATLANRPFAAKPSLDLLFIKLWAATLRMPEMENACQKHQNGQVWSPWH